MPALQPTRCRGLAIYRSSFSTPSRPFQLRTARLVMASREAELWTLHWKSIVVIRVVPPEVVERHHGSCASEREAVAGIRIGLAGIGWGARGDRGHSKYRDQIICCRHCSGSGISGHQDSAGVPGAGVRNARTPPGTIATQVPL